MQGSLSPSQLWNVIRPATLQPPQALTCPEIPVVSLVTKKEACVQVKRKNNFTGAQIKEKTPTKTKHQTNQCWFKAINYSTVIFKKVPIKFQWNWCIADILWNVTLMLTVFEKYLFSAGYLTFLVSGFCGKSALGVLDFVYLESEILVF